MSLTSSVSEQTRAEMREIVARYPRSRSAVMPLLHLVQSEEGYVSPGGIEVVAEELGLTAAEVSAVATFYSMYKRRPVGEFHVGVCTNTLCAVMGGDAIFSDLKDHLGVGNDETTPDGKVTLEHVECNAACDYAPSSWSTGVLRQPDHRVGARPRQRPPAGNDVVSTRGPKVCSFREVSRSAGGLRRRPRRRGPHPGPATLVGLELAHRRGDVAAPAEPPEPGAEEGAS